MADLLRGTAAFKEFSQVCAVDARLLFRTWKIVVWETGPAWLTG